MGILPSITNARRFAEVVKVLAKYGLAEWLSRAGFEGPTRLLTSHSGERLATQSGAMRIRAALTELGTTFVKLGQMLSTRPDLVGDDVADELVKLQDQLPADPPEATLTTVAKELGRPVAEAFPRFENDPLASASIAQVHVATLPDGQEVVVKVQHPGIEPTIRSDLEILETLAGFAERSEELRRYRPVALVKEFRVSLLRELDFTREERNLEHFTARFAGDATVRFPRAWRDLSTARILTMERLVGINLRETERLDRAGVDRDELARRGANVWMEMIFRDGFYHADPHPGNLLVLADGALGVLDCGMVDRVDEELRESLEEILAAMIAGDATQLARHLMRLCDAPPGFDEVAFRADVAEFVSLYGNQTLDRFQLGNALQEIARTISRGNLVLPSGASRLIKVFVMLEGTAKLLSPKINLLQVIAPWQRRSLLRRISPRRQWRKLHRIMSEWQRLGERLPHALGDVFTQIQRGKFDIHLEHKRLEPAVNRLVMGLIVSALFMGSAILWSSKVQPLLWETPVIGVAGCLVSAALGLRLLWKIWRNE